MLMGGGGGGGQERFKGGGAINSFGSSILPFGSSPSLYYMTDTLYKTLCFEQRVGKRILIAFIIKFI